VVAARAERIGTSPPFGECSLTDIGDTPSTT
jgi:hypothetical protein